MDAKLGLSPHGVFACPLEGSFQRKGAGVNRINLTKDFSGLFLNQALINTRRDVMADNGFEKLLKNQQVILPQ